MFVCALSILCSLVVAVATNFSAVFVPSGAVIALAVITAELAVQYPLSNSSVYLNKLTLPRSGCLANTGRLVESDCVACEPDSSTRDTLSITNEKLATPPANISMMFAPAVAVNVYIFFPVLLP